MGHTQCVTQTPEANPEIQVPGPRPCPRLQSLGVPVKAGCMILPSGVEEKSLVPVLELRGEDTTKYAVRVERAMAHLKQSGWYWGPLTAGQAKQVLGEAPEGTFLLRDSSNPGYMLTLSVKTSLGPTHLRIEHSGGAFGFDSLAMARPRLRRFCGAVELVLHYAVAHRHSALCKAKPGSEEVEQEAGVGVGEEVEEEETPESGLQLRLTQPLYTAAPSLQHLCRIAINGHSHSHQDLPLPGSLKAFLQEYPFVL